MIKPLYLCDIHKSKILYIMKNNLIVAFVAFLAGFVGHKYIFSPSVSCFLTEDQVRNASFTKTKEGNVYTFQDTVLNQISFAKRVNDIAAQINNRTVPITNEWADGLSSNFLKGECKDTTKSVLFDFGTLLSALMAAENLSVIEQSTDILDKLYFSTYLAKYPDGNELSSIINSQYGNMPNDWKAEHLSYANRNTVFVRFAKDNGDTIQYYRNDNGGIADNTTFNFGRLCPSYCPK